MSDVSAPTVVIESAPHRVIVRYGGKRFTASSGLQREIDRHWASRLAAGASFTRGPVFHVERVRRGSHEICFDTVMSDYAHYMYTIDGEHGVDDACRVIHTAALLRTRDGVYLLGEMARDTAAPGRLQCAGGGLELANFRDGIADLPSSITVEIHEETGITGAEIMQLEPAYVKSGGEHNFVAVVFFVELVVDESAAFELFYRHCDALRWGGTRPEFSALVAVPAGPEAVSRFLAQDSRPRVDYLDRLLTIDVMRC